MPYDEDLAGRLRELLAGEAGITEKKMFGGLAFLLNGHMSVSASGRGGLLARVDPADTELVVSSSRRRHDPPRGRLWSGSRTSGSTPPPGRGSTTSRAICRPSSWAR